MANIDQMVEGQSGKAVERGSVTLLPDPETETLWFPRAPAFESIRKICYATAAALHGHPEPPAEMLDRSIVGSGSGSS